MIKYLTSAIALGAIATICANRRVQPTGEQEQQYTEVSADRLTEIPTDQLTYLADQFYDLSVDMYTELYIRRTVELGTSQLEAMLHDDGDGS